jgi:E3 SUMO-protein ligase PIAS1
MADLLLNLPPNRSQALTLVNTQLQKLVLQDLKSVCRQEGLTVSGKKAELQQRIYRRFEDYLNNHPNNESFDLLYLRIHRPNEQIGYHHLYSNPSVASINSQLTPSYSSPPVSRPISMPRQISSPIKFVESPFFHRRTVITTFKLPACQHARNDASGPITLNATQLEELRGNSSVRVVVYCGETHSSGHMGAHVKFPAQLEMRVNDQEVKANFKGVGKKEGSVKPVDITPFIRKQHGPNNFKLTYALTTKV